MTTKSRDESILPMWVTLLLIFGGAAWFVYSGFDLSPLIGNRP